MPLKRHPALIPLSHDHRRGLFAANLIRTGAPRYRGYPMDLAGKRRFFCDYVEQDLLIHMELEEKVLFPLISPLAPELAEWAETLTVEHQDLRLSFEELPPEDDPMLQAAFDHLSSLLNAHIRKEERQLFEYIQSVMTEDRLQTLGDAISSRRQYLKKPPH